MKDVVWCYIIFHYILTSTCPDWKTCSCISGPDDFVFSHNRTVAGPVKRRVTAATRTTTEHIYQGQAEIWACRWGRKFALPKDSFGPYGNIYIYTYCGFVWMLKDQMFSWWWFWLMNDFFVYNIFFCIKHVILFTSVMKESFFLFASLRLSPQQSHGKFRIRLLASTGKHPLSSRNFCRFVAVAGPTQFNTDGGLPISVFWNWQVWVSIDRMREKVVQNPSLVCVVGRFWKPSGNSQLLAWPQVASRQCLISNRFMLPDSLREQGSQLLRFQ